ADDRDEHRSGDCREPEGDAPPDDEARTEIRAEHEEGAMRQVRNAHQAEYQREACRQQEQQSAERYAVDGQDQPQAHNRPCGCRDPSALRFQWRIIARIDWLPEEGLLVVSPELADILVGLDGLIHELAVLLLDATNVDIADHISVVVEFDRPARRVGELNAAQRLDESLL